jgi:hypothetical protein
MRDIEHKHSQRKLDFPANELCHGIEMTDPVSATTAPFFRRFRIVRRAVDRIG